MSRETVHIHFETSADTRGADKVERKIIRVAAATKTASKVTKDHGKATSDVDRIVSRMDAHYDRLNKTLDKHTKILKHGLMPALKIMGTSAMALKALLLPAVVGLAGFTAALGTAKLALTTVNVLTKAWNLSLKGLSAGLAAALGGVSMLAAAMTELKAAAAAPFGGMSTKQTQGIFGQLIGDPKIAAMGVNAIQSTAAALMKMKVPVGNLGKYLKEFGDLAFYAGSGDAGKGMEGITKGLEALLKSKTMSGSGLKEFASNFGQLAPNIEAVGKAFVGKDTQKFIDFLMSDPKELAAFNNGLDELNSTMVGLVKSFRPVIQGALEPFGAVLNDTAKGPLTGFRGFLVDIVQKIMPSVVVWLGERLPMVMDKLEGWITRLTDKFQKMIFTVDPENDLFGGKVKGFFQSIVDGWNKAKPALEQMARSWDALWGFMKPIFKGMGGMFGRLLMGGSSGLESTADKWAEMGERIGNVFRAGGPVEQGLKTIFNFVVTLGKTLGPGIGALLSALKSPLYILEEIAKHPDSLRKVGDSLGKIAEALGPVFDLIAMAVGAVLDALPDIAKVVSTLVDGIGVLATILKPVVSAFGWIATHLKVIQGIILWLIGKAVLAKLAAVMTTAASAMAASNSIAGNAAGVGALGASKFMAGKGGMGVLGGLVSLGGMYSNYQSGGSIGGYAAAIGGGAMVGGAIGGPVGALIGGGVGLIGAGLADLAHVDKTKMTDSERLWLDKATGMYDTSSNAGFLGTYANASLNHQTTMPMRAKVGPLVIGSSDELSDADKALMKEMTRRWNSMNEVFNAAGLVGSDQDSFAALADRAGADLMEGGLSLNEGVKMIAQAASEMKSVGDLLQESLDQYIFQPIADRNYQSNLANSGANLMAAISANGYSADLVDQYALPIIQNYQAKVNAGTMTAEQFQTSSVNDLMALENQIMATGGPGSSEAIKLLDTYIQGVKQAAADALTKEETQKKKLEDITNTISDVITGADSAMTSLYQGLMNLNGIQFSIGPDGKLIVTGTDSTKKGDGTPVNGNGGDTYSPRSNLLNTQRMHSFVDAMLPGNRTVTSMFRTYGLGSSNSDHVMGRALDVTGMNLGSYATAIRSMGGFAEFHGVNGSRHLHVVPPNLAIGDRPTPRVPRNRAAQQQYGTQQNFYTTVNPAPNMNEEMLARKTARHIARVQLEDAERR